MGPWCTGYSDGRKVMGTWCTGYSDGRKVLGLRCTGYTYVRQRPADSGTGRGQCIETNRPVT